MRTALYSNEDTVSRKADLPCTQESVEAAKRDQIVERCAVVRMLPPGPRARLVNAFLAETPDVARQPAWQDLQKQEAYEAEQIATAAIGILFGTRAGFTNQQAAALEQGATYLVRRLQPTFVNAAQTWAAETLLASSEFQMLTVGKTKTEQLVLAHLFVRIVRSSLHGVMEAETPVMRGLYEMARGER